jgi:hypothetical protein
VKHSVSVVEPTWATVPIITTTAAIAVPVAVSGPSFVEPTRTAATIAVATVIRTAAAPRIRMEAGTASSGDELDHSITAGLFGRVKREGSRIGRGRKAKPGGHHSSYSQHLHAHHDLNLVGVRSHCQPTGEIRSCASASEPMLTHAQPVCSGNLRPMIQGLYA